ncbi:uroporphyrinogen-III C-methyltransferase [Gallibacterium sp. AGMB14963]|uniref:uroporphyrinogen-III C-methyltransferase n=1 Tax=Gallibacterium faecale TaxID=3019086 RepID=UPI0022F18658|nr:uroporphyrinogen-III C-methyltransferase [Gallibacterium sp. AGMB14963]MDA3979287.1 uroporphyrinogen-III C-methyltransferase [Gallibacterium sp. AGMB14963]
MKKQHDETDIQKNTEINEEVTPNRDEESKVEAVTIPKIDAVTHSEDKKTEKQPMKEEKKVMAAEPKKTDSAKQNTTPKENKVSSQPETQIKKSSSGKGIALLALLIALGVGGAGYYLGQQQLSQLQQKITSLEESQQAATQATPAETVSKADFDAVKNALVSTTSELEAAKNALSALEQNRGITEQQIIALQSQLNKAVADKAESQPNEWLMSEADFLLSNAQRKLLIDNDLSTAISLLKEADVVLNDVSDPRAISVRTAIAQDLKRLADVNDVDQNAIMQKLSQLANAVDDLEVLDLSSDNATGSDDGELSDSISDWRTNIEKSANSFLNHFIRIQPRDPVEKALLAPNQDVYLRENIRLRLQIALLAVPRQQNELYKGSLEAVTSWVRSYFNTDSVLVQRFLQQLDDLSEQSIYVDAPSTFESLTTLDEILHKQPHKIEKVEMKANPTILEENKAEEAKAKENAEAQSQATEQPKAAPEQPASQTEESQPAATEAPKNDTPAKTE